MSGGRSTDAPSRSAIRLKPVALLLLAWLALALILLAVRAA